MNVALRRSMTLEQFLAWEERQELRYEFDGTEQVLSMPEVVIDLPLDEIYDGVEFRTLHPRSGPSNSQFLDPL